MGNIVYHEMYGFGVVLKIDNIVYNVYFYNQRNKRKLVKDFLKEIPQKFVEYCISYRFDNEFSYSVKKRAVNYTEEYIADLKYDNKTISAKINGTSTYLTKINIDNNFLRYCSCPVNGDCKHEYALYLYVAQIFKFLIKIAKEYGDNNSFTPGIQTKAAIISAISNDAYVCANTKCVVDDLLKNLKVEYFISFFNLIEKNYQTRFSYGQRQVQKNAKNFISSIFLNEKLNKFVINHDNELRASDFYVKINKDIFKDAQIIEEVNNNSMRVELIKEACYYYLNDKYDETLANIIYGGLFNLMDSMSFAELVQKCHLDADLINTYIEKCGTDERYYYTFKALFNKLDNQDKIKLINDNKNLRVNLNDFNFLTIEELEKYSERLKFVDASQALSFIDQAKAYGYSNKNIGKLFMRSYNDANDSNIKRSIISKIRKMNNSQYFVDYLESVHYNYGYHYWFGEDLEIIPNLHRTFDSEAFFAFFDYEVNLEVKEDNYCIKYSVNNPLNETILVIYRVGSIFYQKINRIDNDDTYLFAYDVCCFLNQKENEKISKLIEQGETETAQARFKKNRDIALSQMNEINQLFASRQVILSTKNKARLQYFFTINNQGQFLQLKVGITKMYVVKDACEFINDFINEETKTYGKDLILSHQISNFEDTDQKIIKYLINGKNYSDYERKNFVANDFLFLDLIEALKGKSIYFNNEECLLRLNEITPEVEIDENYQLNFNTGMQNALIYFFNDYLLFYDHDNHVIDIHHSNHKNMYLFQFAYLNNGFNFESIKKEFNERVYSNYPGIIKINEKRTDDFKLSQMLIKSYFDYKDKNIIVENKYYIDDKQIGDFSKLSNNDAFKKAQHQEYLKSMGFNEDGCISDDSSLLAFFYMNFDELKQYCEVYLSDSIKNKSITCFTPSKIIIKQESTIMQAFLDESEYSNEELETILKSIKRNKKYALLKGDRIIDLSNMESLDFYETVNDLHLDSSHLHNPQTISVVESLKAFAHENNCSIDKHLKKIIDEISHFQDANIPDVKINGELRDYQKQAYKWLKILSNYNLGGILADDMGLGKTVEIIALLKSSNENKPSLIVCPKSVVYNWIIEIKKFAPELKTKEIVGLKQDRVKIISNINNDEKIIYITPFDTLRNDIDDYSSSFAYLIVDEAQFIKNVRAQKTMSVKNIKAEHCFALTGTPIENNIIDLWSIFDLVLPGYLENVDIYKNKYNDEKTQELLAKRIAPFVLRRTKQNVLKDLPEKYERILTADMDDKQRKLYEAVRMDARSKLDSQGKAFDILPYLMKLRQICVDPSLCVENYKGKSSKMDVLDEIIDEYIENGHRLLIFSQFVSALNVVEKMLSKKKIKYFMITGDTTSKKRIEIADKFNNDSVEKICLVSLKAGGTGLNLIGADTVIHLDPWWNVSAENQASDRSYRIGQTKNVEIIKLICSNSIEQRVIELQNIKKDLIDKLISKDESSIKNSSLEDIKFILD